LFLLRADSEARNLVGLLSSFDSLLRETVMSFADQVRAAAIRIAEGIKRQAEVNGNIEGASLAYERLARFEPEIGGTLQCPTCWIQYGAQAPLVAIPAISPAPTRFKCDRCDFHL
jgi:hypothetical protein